VWISEETRTNISIVTPSGGHYIKVNEKGPAIPPEKQRELLEKIEQLAQPGDWWVLAGSLPPGVPDTFYAQIVQRLNQCGSHTLLDTINESLRLGCQVKPYLVKPNAEEAGALTGLTMQTLEDTVRCAAKIRGMGAENVVISMGKAGALLQTSEATWLTHSPSVVEKNPIGAGDSMVGGLVWALSRGLSLDESLRWGVASGAATASLSGTEVGSQSLIEMLLAQTQSERLDF
jgi:1-phosphofructokinase family hexose kinase